MPSGYLYRKKITYSTTTAENSCVFYLSLASLGNISALIAKNDGSDILVTDLNGASLSRDLVSGTFSKAGAAPAGELYFKGDALAGSTSFFVYYGNAAGSVANSATTWTGSSHHAVYHMQDTSGVEPDRANSYDLTIEGTVARGVSGLYGVGYAADIENDTPGRFSSTSLFQSVSDAAWTISLATKIESLTAGSAILARNGTQFIGPYIFIGTDGKLYCYLINNFGANDYIYKYTTNAAVSTGTTKYLDITYDGSKTAAGLKFYCDGSLCAATVGFDSLTGTISANNTTYIGLDAINSYKYDGVIDEFRISTVERTAASILQQYNLKSGGYTVTVASQETINLDNFGKLDLSPFKYNT